MNKIKSIVKVIIKIALLIFLGMFGYKQVQQEDFKNSNDKK